MATSRSKLAVISLYSGVGGLDFGFEAAGFRVAVAVEMDSTACHTIRLNRPKWPVIEADISRVTTKKILRAGGLRVGEAAVLIAGPPCQPFSKSGYWVNGDTRRLSDPRANTLTDFLRVLKEARPKAFLLENVYGLAYKGKDEGLQLLLDGIDRVNKATGDNYSVTWEMLNAADFGVPQIRERVFVVGSRNGQRFQFPAPTHAPRGDEDLFSLKLRPYTTAWDAIGDLPPPKNLSQLEVRGKWGGLLPSIPEGQNYLWHTNRRGGLPLFGWRTRYWSFLLKLSKRLPSWTIQAQPGAAIGPFHWKNRRLTTKEMCRLQTFPEDVIFHCGRTEVQRMLGNAVPSLLAEVIAAKIGEQFFGRPRLTTPKLLRGRRSVIPGEEKVKRVPKRYLEYVGDHPDHPGEGRLSRNGSAMFRRTAKLAARPSDARLRGQADLFASRH